MSQVRIAVFGAGHLGSIHARLLHARSDAQLVAVVDPDMRARDRVERELGVATATSLEKLTCPIDAAIVATPTIHHSDLAGQLLRRGCHTFVEKPLTPNAAQASKLCHLAAQSGAVLQVGHSERFNAAWQAGQPMLQSCRRIRAIRESGFPSRSLDVGVVLDLMIHEVDLVLSLTTAPIRHIEAHGTTIVGPHEDIVSARLEFANGLVAELEASRVSPRRQRSWQVITDSGLVWIDFATHAVETALAVPQFASQQGTVHRLPIDDRRAFADQLFSKWLPKHAQPTTETNALVAEHDEFLGAIQGRGRVTVTGDDGRRAVEVCEWILQAMGEPVRVIPSTWHSTSADAA